MAQAAIAAGNPPRDNFTAPWLFVPMGQMAGIFNGFIAVVLPYVGVQKGLSVAAVGAIIGVGMLATPVKLLWSPVLDMWWTLKGWMALGGVLTIATTAAMFQVPMDSANLPLLMAFAFALGTASQIGSSGCTALLVLTVDPRRLSEAAGYYQGGQLIYQGAGGAAGLWIATHWGMWGGTAFFAALLVATLLPVVKVVEPERRLVSAEFVARLVAIGREMVEMARQPRRRWAMIAFLTPIGAGGASYLWAAIAPDWHAGPGVVAIATGLGAAGASALGCFVYGLFIGHVERIRAFLVTSVLLVLAAVLLAVLPREPAAFAAGTLIYSLMLGFSYASYGALQFETVGEGAVASKNALLNAFGNVPVTYMPVLLGIVHDDWSVTAMLMFEAVLTGAFITVFGLAVPRRRQVEAAA